MNKNIMEHIKNNWAILIIIVMSSFVYFIIYGTKLINPQYDLWLLKGGDLSQHYIGWEFFRKSTWQFPIGLMNTMSYPNNVSVIFTDSIPIAAILFKIMSPLLSNTFQYFGLWEFLCFVLQGVFSYNILHLLTKNKLGSILGALFFITAPIFITRVYLHTALSSQWLILAALYIFYQTSFDNKMGSKYLLLRWGILGFLCSFIHLYYIPMCGIIMISTLLIKVYREKKLLHSFIIAFCYIFVCFISIFVLGAFSHDHQLDAGGLGQFSFNLNGFFNSMGWSKFFSPLSSYGEGSGEGFAYLGLGIYGITIACILIVVNKIVYDKRKFKFNFINIISHIFMFVLFLLISCSYIVAINGNITFRLPYPEKLISLWGMFRASGRFIWPVIYILMIYLISYIINFIKNQKTLIIILMAMFILQIHDISGVLKNKHDEFTSSYEEYGLISNDEWNNLLRNKKHIVFVSKVTENQDILYSISQYAIENNMTINDFYFAHSAVSGEIIESLNEYYMNDINNYTAYIFKPNDYENIQKFDLDYFKIDNFIVGIKK